MLKRNMCIDTRRIYDMSVLVHLRNSTVDAVVELELLEWTHVRPVLITFLLLCPEENRKNSADP